MVSKKQSGKLPSDWTEHLSVKNGKTTLYYTNAATGQKFCSRQSLDRYLNARGVVCEAKITSAVSTGSVRSDKPTPSLAVVKEEDKPREWLPQGWIMESRKRGFTKHGSVYRVYIEKSTGCKFYSKGKVLQYLEKAHHDSNIGKENNEVNEMSDHKESVEDELHISGDKDEPKLTMSEHSESVEDKSHKSGKKNSPKSTMSEHSVSVEDKCHKSGKKNTPKLTMSEHSESVEDKCHKSGKKDAASNPALEDKGNKMEVDDDELPQGWTKELRTRSYKGKTKHDPYYTDPVTGYIFRSKKDVWRYLKTGDIKKCASKVLKGNTPQSPLPVSAKKKKHSASTSQLSDVAEKDVDEKPGSVEAVECHKSEENSVTKNEGFKQESKLADDDGVSSLIRTTPSRKSKRKPPSGPQRSSKRLAGLNRDVKEPTLSAAVKEEIGKSPPLSSKVAINGVKTSLGCGVAKDTNALFNNEAVTKVTPHQLESSNPAFNEVPPQKIDTNLYTESSNAAVNEVPPQQLDTILYNESSNAAANEPVHDTTEPGDKRSVEIDAVVSELPQEFVTNFDATGTSAVASQSRVEMDLNSTLELLFEDMDVQHQQTSLGQKNATQKEVDPKFQGDYWSDPCFDFAFKTVAGEEQKKKGKEKGKLMEENNKSSSKPRPNRSDVHLSKEEEAKIEENTRHYFDEIAPKRHTKPQRSEYSTAYSDDYDSNAVIPESLEFQRLEQTGTQKLMNDEGGKVPEEFTETEYYKNLNCIDHQHHTTGTGFIKVDNKNGTAFSIDTESATDNHVSSLKSNPATNEWIPTPDNSVDFFSDKPNRSDN